MVLLHGFGISSAYFVPAIERLEGVFEVYAPDLPGHGRSGTPRKALDIEGFADAVSRWMAAMHIERASIVGHSMGCQIGVELAVRHTRAVDRLVLISPTADREARSLRRLLPRFIANGTHEPASMAVLTARDYLRMSRRLHHELRVMLRHRIEDVLPEVTAPVLFIGGGKDRVAPRRWIDELAQLTLDSRVAAVPDAAHALHYSAPDRLMDAMGPFLREGVAASA